MRELKNNLTSGKNTKNIKTKKGKAFGYQVLGFGSGGGPLAYNIDFVVVGAGSSEVEMIPT